MTAAGTTTVVVNAAKRDLVKDEACHLAARADVDFAALASVAGLNLAKSSVSTACSCFSSSYTFPTATATVVGGLTTTVAVAKGTVTVTTTVKAATV